MRMLQSISWLTLLVLPVSLPAQVLPEVPEGAQAISLLNGEPLYVPEPGEAVLERLETGEEETPWSGRLELKGK